jgi:hypothetical protein
MPHGRLLHRPFIQGSYVRHMTTTEALSLAGRLGLDALALIALVGWLHRRRDTAPEMALVFTALNIGLFAAVTVIGTGSFPTGIGFGLFGLLSLVRLRSAAFTLKDVAYTFVALILALVNALPDRNVAVVVALDVLVLAAVWLADTSRSTRPSRVMRLTLDRAVTDPAEIRAELERRVSGEVLSVVVDDVDFVRDTTRVSVRHHVDDSWWSWSEARVADQLEVAREEVAGDA